MHQARRIPIRRALRKTMKTPEEQLRDARKCTERLINVRERSSTELYRRLLRAGISEDVANREVENAIVTGLVDDERFAQMYIESKKRGGWGKNHIEAKLRFFGIEIRGYEGYPERFFNENEELCRAEEYLKRFHTTSKDPRTACFRRLTSRGYSLETAQTVLKKLTI